MPAETSRCSSRTSFSSSSSYSPTCRTGAAIKCPDEYGNLFSRTMAFVPRCTTSFSSSSPSTAAQKTQPVSSSADLMYSRRQGAHSCFTQPSLERLGGGLDEHGLWGQPSTERGEVHHRGDHAQHDQEGGGEEERLGGGDGVSRTVDSRVRLRAADSCYGMATAAVKRPTPPATNRAVTVRWPQTSPADSVDDMRLTSAGPLRRSVEPCGPRRSCEANTPSRGVLNVKVFDWPRRVKRPLQRLIASSFQGLRTSCSIAARAPGSGVNIGS